MTNRTFLVVAQVAAAAALLLGGRAVAGETSVSGSVYVDYFNIPNNKDARARAPQALTPEASLKVDAGIHEDLDFSAKACMGCHGIELDHVALEYTPKGWFNAQVGRIAVPFGEFSNRVDPSGHKTASKPLIYDMGRMAYSSRETMNFGVLPQPYVDTGLLLYGQTWLGQKIQVWYGGYAVAGFKGTNDFEFARMRGGNYQDNNNVPAGGGRLALSYASDPGAVLGDASLGFSFTAGKYDDAAKLGYAIGGVDATFRILKATLRGEYVERRTDLDKTADYGFVLLDKFFSKSGWYAEIEHPITHHVSAVYRMDQLRRSGAPLPGAEDAQSTFTKLTRHSAGAVITPVSSAFVKLGWEFFDSSNLQDFHSFHFGVGGAF